MTQFLRDGLLDVAVLPNAKYEALGGSSEGGVVGGLFYFSCFIFCLCRSRIRLTFVWVYLCLLSLQKNSTCPVHPSPLFPPLLPPPNKQRPRAPALTRRPTCCWTAPPWRTLSFWRTARAGRRVRGGALAVMHELFIPVQVSIVVHLPLLVQGQVLQKHAECVS
jgi:hypothetical protein